MKHLSMFTPPYSEFWPPLFLTRYVDCNYYKRVLVEPTHNVQRAAIPKACQHQAAMASWVIRIILHDYKSTLQSFLYILGSYTYFMLSAESVPSMSYCYRE